MELGPSDPDNLLFLAVTLFETGDLKTLGLGRVAEAKTQLKGYLSRAAGLPVPPHPPELASRLQK